MKILLTINGLGSRFTKAGISTPKFLLDFEGSSILSAIVTRAVLGTSNHSPSFIVGINKRYDKFKKAICESLKVLPDYRLIWMNDSKGQADTVANLLKYYEINNDSGDFSFWVMNCDTLVNSTWQNYEEDVVVEVFKSTSDKYSYIDDLENVSAIAEKIVISDHASTGNYYFKSAQRYKELYEQTEIGREIFVSDVIRKYIEEGFRVKGDKVQYRDVIVLGTPEQYRAYHEK